MKKAKYRQLVDKYKKEIQSLREDILALVGDDESLKAKTYFGWKTMLRLEEATVKSMMFGTRTNDLECKGILDQITTNPVMANEHTLIDVNFGGKHASTICSSATKIVAPADEDYLSVARGLFCTGIDHAAYFILNGYTFSQKKGCILKCVDNKTGQTFEGAEAEKMLFIAKGNQLLSDTNTIKGQFDFYKIFMDTVEEMEQSVETLGHA